MQLEVCVLSDEEGTDPRDLRVSDAERDHVRKLLEQAMARGMIDADEFETRTAQAIVARTRADLNPLVADVATTGSGDDVVELTGTFSSLKRKGAWRVPRRLVLRRRMGSAELDFTQADIVHPVVDIELDIGGGSVEMRLPEGASASIDGVHAIRGSVEDHRKNPSPDGHPHFVITGEVRWGSVELRGPRRWPFRGQPTQE
jgi:hypothetical protein